MQKSMLHVLMPETRHLRKTRMPELALTLVLPM